MTGSPRKAVSLAISFAVAVVGLGGSACSKASSPPADIVVHITPAAPVVGSGGQIQLQATVDGTADQQVTWSVTGTGNGSISASGLFTAPTGPKDVVVVAQSHADTNATASVTVHVNAPGVILVHVTPAAPTVATGGQQQFTATVDNTADQVVTWSVIESACGSITTGGLYTAPGTATSCTVKATSHADATKSGTATVTVTSGGNPAKISLVWIGNTGLYPWGCSAAAGCSGTEASTTPGNSFYAGIQAHTASFTHVSITLYTLNQCDATCTCPASGCHDTTHGVAYQSGRPFLVSCNTLNGTQMCHADGPEAYDGDQATRSTLSATYHGLGLKVSALVYAGSSNFGTDKGAAAIMCGGSVASGQSIIDPTLANVCAPQRNFINAMVAEAQTYGYDDINLDWELGEAANGSDANLGAAPTYPKITGAYGPAFSNFLTNFKSALRAAGLATTLSVDPIPSNVNGTTCSGNGGYIDAQVLTAPGGALTSGSLDYLIIQAYNPTLITPGGGAAPGYPPATCGTSPTWANNYYGSDILDRANPASCDDSLTGYALMMCPPNWGATLAEDTRRVIIGMDAGLNSSNAIAGRAMQRITDYGFRGVAIWPDYDGSAATSSFMSTEGINTTGFTLGGSNWYQMLANWKAAP